MSSEEEVHQWEINLFSKGIIGNTSHYDIDQFKQIQKKEMFQETDDVIEYLQKKQKQNTQSISTITTQIEINQKDLQCYQNQLHHIEDNQIHRQELFKRYQSICIELDSSHIPFERKKQLLNELKSIEKELLKNN